MKRFTAILFVTIAALAAPPGPSRVRLAWDYTADANNLPVQTFIVYADTHQVVLTDLNKDNCAVKQEVGPGLTTVIGYPLLSPGTWYFAVTARDTSGNESLLSNVVSTNIVLIPPSPVLHIDNNK